VGETGAKTSQHPVRRGGVIWLATAISVALTWWAPLGTWQTMFLTWVFVGLSYLIIKKIQSSLSFPETIGATSVLGVLWILAWNIGLLIDRCLALLSFESDPDTIIFVHSYAILLCIAISLMIGGIAIVWLLSAVIPRSSIGIGTRPLSVLARSWLELKQNKRIWSAALLTAIIQVSAVMVAISGNRTIQTMMGLVIAYSQLIMIKNTEQKRVLHSVNGNVMSDKQKRNVRNWSMAAIFSLHTLLFLFYFALFSIGGVWGLKAVTWYLLSLVMGGLIALTAWLIGRMMIVYFLLLLLLLLVNAIMLGLIVGVYGVSIIL
jgi:hypothetical protein